MSFLKITDPKKRDLIVQEFLKTKQNIQQSNLAERVGDLDTQRDLSKFFKPVTQQTSQAAENIINELKPIQQATQDIPKAIKAITLPQPTQVRAVQDDEDVIEPNFIGPIAEQYLRKFAAKEGVDKTYGLYSKEGKFYIGDKQVIVSGDNIEIGGDEYQGTPGLWELLISTVPDETIYTNEDYKNYAKIMVDTNSIRWGNKPGHRPKSSKSWKWKHIMRAIWDNKDAYKGSGVAHVAPAGPPVSSARDPDRRSGIEDPNALLSRFNLLMASRAAGNTGVQNELVSILNELKKHGILLKI